MLGQEAYGNTKYSGGNTVEIPSGANRGGVFLHLSIMVHAAATYCSAFHPYGTRKFGGIISTIIIITIIIIITFYWSALKMTECQIT